MNRNATSIGMLLILASMTIMAFGTVPVNAASTWYVNGVSGLDTNPGTSALPFKTITKAITMASDDDTVMVAAATYKEEVDVTKALMIVGAGADTTIIDGTGVALAIAGLAKITATAGNVVFTGFTIRNAAPVGADNLIVEVFTQSSVTGVTYTISYNKIYGTNDASKDQDYGFYDYSGKEDLVFTHNLVTQTGANSVLLELHTGATEISYNTLDTGCYGCDSIFCMTYNGIDIKTLQNVIFNTFDMGTGEAFDYEHKAHGVSFDIWPIEPEARFTNMVISGNTFNNLKNNTRAIGFWNSGTGHNLVAPQITHNTVDGIAGSTNSSGVDFYGLTDNAYIGCNTIRATDTAIYLRNGDAPGTQIHYNNIQGNSVGVNWTLGSTAVDATNNYWGYQNGPSPLGLGDKVTDKVGFVPFLRHPSNCAPRPRDVYLVVRGMDDRIYCRTWNGTSWEDWMALPASTTESPAAAILGNELHIVIRGSDGTSLWHGYVDLTDDAFSGWTLLDGATPSAPTLTSNGTALCLVVRGMDDRIYHRCYSGSWDSWYAVPTGATPDAPAAAMLGDNLHIVVRGMDNSSLWDITVACDGTVVRDWNLLSGATPSRPVLASAQDSDTLYLAVRGMDNVTYYMNFTGSTDSWGAWNALPTGATCDGPGATIVAGKLHIVVRGMDEYTLWHGYVDLSTSSFSGWTLLSGATPSAPTLTS